MCVKGAAGALLVLSSVLAQDRQEVAFNCDGTAAAVVPEGGGGRCRIVPGARASFVTTDEGGPALSFQRRARDDEPRSRVEICAERFDPRCFTVAVRCRFRGPVIGHDQYLLCSHRLYLRFSIDRHAIQFGVHTPTGWKGTQMRKEVLPGVKTNRWYLIAGSYDGTEIRLFVDVKLHARTPASGDVLTSSLTLGSCGWSARTSYDFEGEMSAVRFVGLPKAGAANLPEAKPVRRPIVSSQGLGLKSRPLVIVPKSVEPPPITGLPTGPLWERSAWIGNPVYCNDTRITDKLDWDAGLLWDDEALYVGFVVRQHRRPKTETASAGDDGLERDDAVEVTLRVPGFAEANGQVVQFKLNAAGLRDDAIHFSFKWDAEWDGKVARDGHRWCATFRIPFSNFGVRPQIGDRWQANFGAFQVGMKYRAFLWAPVSLRHHHDGDFGLIEFGAVGTPSTRVDQFSQELSSLIVSGHTSVRGRVRIDRPRAQEKATLDGNVIINFDAEGRSAAAQTLLDVAAPGPWTCRLDGLRSGEYLAKVMVLGPRGETLQTDVKPVVIARSVALTVRRYPVRGAANVVVDISDLGRPGVLPGRLKLQVESEGRSLHDVRHSLDPILPQRRELFLDNLPNDATYRVQVTVESPDGRARVAEATSFELPPRPAWADTDAGLGDGSVPAPWVPVGHDGSSLTCWGRSVDFGGALLPVQISSQGHPLLRGPMTMQLDDRVMSGGPLTVQISPGGDRAEFGGAAGRVQVRGYLEYDGLMRYDLHVVPPPEGIAAFALEVPLRTEVAELVQPLPSSEVRDKAGAIPLKGLRLDPQHTLWLCNGDVGVFFCWESTRFWDAPEQRAIEILPRGDETLLRLNFYRSQTPLRDERTYSFFMQATPIRPRNPDWFSFGCRRLAGLNWGMNVSALEDDTVRRIPLPKEYLAAGAIETEVTNRSDLAALSHMDFPHRCWDQALMRITGGARPVRLYFSKRDAGLVLDTPWGRIQRRHNALWPRGDRHRLTLRWGRRLELLIDGVSQGKLAVEGLPVSDLVLRLGSVSARFTLHRLTLSKLEGKTLVVVADGIDLHSNARTPLHEARDLGCKYLSFFEHWSHAQNGGTSRYEPGLKLIAEDVHRLGMKFILYFGFEIGVLPENRDLLDECKGRVDQSPNYYSPHKQNTYAVSYGGPYPEYLLHHMRRLKRELGIDGVYLDGTLNLRSSDNPAFGCGWTDDAGRRHKTVPAERIRSFAKRINRLFVQDGGIAFAHLYLSPPTMGFVSNTYLGEHVGFLNLDWQSVRDVIPDDVTRCLYNPRNTGVPMVLCIQNMWPHLRSIKPYWYPRASAWADLHGIDINVLLECPMADVGLVQMAKNRRLAELGVDRCEWLPYWRPDNLAVCRHPDLRVSAYRRRDGAMILALANIGKAPLVATLDFSRSEGLRVPDGASASCLLTGRELALEGQRLRVRLDAYAGSLVVVEP